jgi:hypothetical protein
LNLNQELEFTVGQVPQTKPFELADLAELLILVGFNNEISKADIESLINAGCVDSDPSESATSNDEEVDSYTAKDKSLEDCFKNLSYRAHCLDEDYPFLVNGHVLSAKSHISSAGYLYLFCLICSRLSSFSGRKGFHQHCAKIFTEVAKVSLKASLKSSAEVYIFDAGSEDRKLHFHTDLRKALVELAKKLNATPDTDVIDQQSSSGDAGIDLVAINSFGDHAKGVFAYFGQCAAQQSNWTGKVFETRKSGAFFKLAHPSKNLLYIPVFYRTSSGRWANELHAHGAILVDRLRILKSIKGIDESSLSFILKCSKAVVDQAASAITN